MTLRSIRPYPAPHRVPPRYTPRLRLTSKARRADYVQGAWWPRSGDLESELPDLLAVLTVRLGSIERVVYDPDGWALAPRQLAAVGRAVRLDAYRFHAFNTMYVFGSDGARIVLRVIPAATDAESAHSSLMMAVGPCRTAARGRRPVGH